MTADRPLAEIVAEGRVLQIEIAESDLLSGQRAEAWRTYDHFARAHVSRLLDAVEKAIALFITLDRVAPGWREDACTIGGDDVNRAWSELERALGLGPDALAAPAPEGEGRNG